MSPRGLRDPGGCVSDMWALVQVFSTMEGLVKRKECFSERDVMHIFTSALAAVR